MKYLIFLLPFLLQAQLVDEHFESGAIPSGWTTVAGSDWVPTYTPALEGSYSLQGDTSAATSGTVTIPFTASDSIWFFFKTKMYYPTNTSNPAFSIRNSTTSQAELYFNYTTQNHLRVLSITGNPIGSFTVSNGLEVGIKGRYVKGTGADAILQIWIAAWNDDGSWTTPVSPDINVSAGAGTVQIDNVVLTQTAVAGGDGDFNIWDAIVIYTDARIGDYTPPSDDTKGFKKSRLVRKYRKERKRR